MLNLAECPTDVFLKNIYCLFTILERVITSWSVELMARHMKQFYGTWCVRRGILVIRKGRK
jgi:hypothetical protein